MPRKLYVVIVCLAIAQISYAQPRSLRAVFTDVPPHIDGVLDDEVWKTAERSGGFIMDKPNPGKPHGQYSEVAVMYDNQSVYVGFWNYDTAPDSILRQLCGRDQGCNTDYCAVTFSCLQDGVNGFMFIVSPNGTQGDARVDGNGMDLSWNAVWY
ncbi:MAG: carbohydrate binding family 9 domain-containing protein, partial [Flavobacteriales bacterium]